MTVFILIVSTQYTRSYLHKNFKNSNKRIKIVKDLLSANFTNNYTMERRTPFVSRDMRLKYFNIFQQFFCHFYPS